MVHVSPRVSIIIPAYQAERFLARTLESVCAQSFRNWEIVIVDDGSYDRTAEIVRRSSDADPRCRGIFQANHGVAAARNRGFSEASSASEFVVFLDHDDVWEPTALERLVTLLEDSPGCAAAYGLARQIDRDDVPVSDCLESWGAQRVGFVGGRMSPWEEHQPTTFEVLALGNCIVTPGQVLIRRSALPPCPFEEAAAPCDDYQLWLTLSLRGPFAYLPEVVTGWRSHPDNQSKRRLRMWWKTLRVVSSVARRSDVNRDRRRLLLASVAWRFRRVLTGTGVPV